MFLNRKNDVDTGYWPLFRYDPSDGKRFRMDSDIPSKPISDYNCLDGSIAQHGLFLIDAKGIIQWSAIGEKPFDDIEKLLRLDDEYGISGTPRK